MSRLLACATLAFLFSMSPALAGSSQAEPDSPKASTENAAESANSSEPGTGSNQDDAAKSGSDADSASGGSTESSE